MIRLCAFADEAGNPLNEQIRALKDNDLSLLELRSIDGVNVSEFTVSKAKEYKKQLADNGIDVWSIGSPLGKVSIDTDFNVYSDTVKKVCELANVFGTKRIRAFSFFFAYEKRNKVFDNLSKMVEIAKEFGANICHENEKEIYGDTLSRCLDIMNNVKGLKHVYDPANFIQCGEKADDTINALFDKIDYFHVKDVVESTGELVPAGEGDGKIDKIISKVKDDKVFTLEPHLAVFDAYKSIDNSEMKLRHKFTSNKEAFDFAVNSLKRIIINCGYKQKDGGFVK